VCSAVAAFPFSDSAFNLVARLAVVVVLRCAASKKKRLFFFFWPFLMVRVAPF
jgi:hypothetical protein